MKKYLHSRLTYFAGTSGMNKQARNPGTVQKRMANYDRKEGRTARSTGPIFKQICFTMMYKKDPQKSDLKKKQRKTIFRKTAVNAWK